jgi:thiol-disulfide isomerase/thioredoxin
MTKVKLSSILSIILFLVSCTPRTPSGSIPVYTEALSTTKLQNKKLIVIFGADWCPDCHALNSMLVEEKVSKLIQSKYIVLKIDVGRFDKNLDLNELLGDPIDNGIPALVILDPKQNNPVIASTKGGEFSSARQMSSDHVFKYLNQF